MGRKPGGYNSPGVTSDEKTRECGGEDRNAQRYGGKKHTTTTKGGKKR